MDNNRLHLNFRGMGGGGGNYPQGDGSTYPTTPSTFPQPLFSPQSPGTVHAAQEYLNAQMSPNAIGGNNYFAQAPLQEPQRAYTGQNGGNPNDLIQQFSNQDLSGSSRGYARAQSPMSQRPRTGGGGSGQPLHNRLAPPAPNHSPRSAQTSDEEPPERVPEKYSQNISKRGTMAHATVETFFTENIQRARERNVRAQELETALRSPDMSDTQRNQKRIDLRNSEAQYLRFLRTRETPANFSTIKIIGKGAFGEVKLVQRKTDGKIYALKSLVKAEMFKREQLAHVRAERDILAEVDSTWVVKLHTTFQDPTFLYMLMEFLPGGDLMTMLIKYEIFTEDITRFYMAELVLAIESVHKLGYIHRDIKPDNILLDRGGHIKLTDFGLSTGFHKRHDNSYYQQLLRGTSSKSQNRNSVSLNQISLTLSNRSQINTWRKSRRVMAYSTVGTPDYIAPEIFGGQGYSYECDWWSVGAIMFECLIGWPPFCADEAPETYRKIVNWRETLYFPEDIHLSPTSEDMIRSLLCDASNRLGRGGTSGGQQIKQHPFFHGVIWDQLRRIRAPFEPRLSSNVDVSYFPINDIDQSDHSAGYRAQAKNLSEEHEAEMSLPFVGYTYKRFDAFRGT
ncbi:MAG: Serine/threonine-protein kinase [Cirrosporium novae-zelandiae]|nr:MAG: Serine/threonine-protein kinase [Cirrosporium novae-zelandiae]